MRSFHLALTLAYAVALANAVPHLRTLENTATEPNLVGGVRIPHRECPPSPICERARVNASSYLLR